MLEFIKNHYELIASCLFLLISVLLVLVKKKPIYNQLDEIKTYILSVLPGLIRSVEQPGNGSAKKELVITELKLLLAKNFGFYQFDTLIAFIDNAIEAILNTPEKK